MRLDWTLLRAPLAFFAVAMAAVAAFGETVLAPRDVPSALVSGMLCVVHVVIGFVVLELSYDRSPTVFLKIVLGGMTARLLLMLGAVLVLIKIYGFPPGALLLGLLVWYAAALAFEVTALQRKVTLKQQPPLKP